MQRELSNKTIDKIITIILTNLLPVVVTIGVGVLAVPVYLEKKSA